jgi:hypothetical protein
MTATHELFGEMGADESGAAGDEIRRHEVSILSWESRLAAGRV